LNGIIGRDGKIPWNSKSDLKHFRETTLDHPVIMGRRTFESIGSVLDRRINIVLSRNSSSPIKDIPGIILCTSLDNAYDYCVKNNYNRIFIIGGAQIFNQTIDEADELIISRINLTVEGDTEFPSIEEKMWQLESSQKFSDFELRKYVKAT
jgi:dihydrofolate reductase